MSFIDKRVLVTGGAQGLGRATVEKFLEAGAKVFTVDKDLGALDTLKADCPAVTAISLDLLDWEATIVELEKYGPFDHLVNNAGIYKINENFLHTKESDVDNILGVNFKAAVNVAKIFSNGVVDNGIIGASIVNISSIYDRNAICGSLLYCCSKAAVTMLTKCLAKELGPYGIRVNCIRPTAMRTNILGHDPLSKTNFEAKRLAAVADSAIPRILDTSEAAELILYLCSSKAAMITGQDIAIDGGYKL